MPESNLDLVRRTYDAFNRWGADPEATQVRAAENDALLHPEIEFHTYADAPEAGIYHGREAVLDYNQRLYEQFERIHIEVEELLPAEDRVVVISSQHAVPKGGREAIVVRVVEVWVVRDGRLAERRTYSTREEALEAVGLSE
jgi:ketosteroid isomerase-like protein